MGNSKFVKDPTLGKNVVVPRSAKLLGSIEPQNRALAQPLPGVDIPKVKGKGKASKKEKADALTQHSTTGKVYEPEEEVEKDNTSSLEVSDAETTEVAEEDDGL